MTMFFVLKKYRDDGRDYWEAIGATPYADRAAAEKYAERMVRDTGGAITVAKATKIWRTVVTSEVVVVVEEG